MPRRLAKLSLAVAFLAAAPFALAQPATQPSGGSGGAAAATADLPAGEKLLEKYIEATGGRAAYEKINNRTTSSSMEVPAAGIKATMNILQAQPNKARVTIDIPGAGKVEQGSDGETVWEKSDMQGVRILTGPEREASLRQFMLNSELKYKDIYKSIETVGMEDVAGKPAYKVKLVTRADDNTMHYFYDVESGLMVRSDMTAKTQFGDLPVNITMGDYRDVDGIKIPMQITQRQGPTEIKFTIDSVKHNTDLPADAFALPPEVKALKDKAPATQPGN